MSFFIAMMHPALKNTETWPQVDEQSIVDEQKRCVFLARRQAIRRLLEDASDAEICGETGLPRREESRLLKRCLAVSPDGQIFGFGV